MRLTSVLSSSIFHSVPEEAHGTQLSDRDIAMGWVLSTFFRHVGVSKTQNNVLERMQSFMMKDKRGGFKLGSRSAKAKVGIEESNCFENVTMNKEV
jgi:hypothetical protein